MTTEQRVAEIERDMDRKLTVKEHLFADVVEFDATGDDTDIRIKTRFKAPVLGVVPLLVRNLDNPDAPGSTTVQMRWSEGGQIEAFNFPGLASGIRYRVRLLVIGG
jgi:hypothetical protein